MSKTQFCSFETVKPKLEPQIPKFQTNVPGLPGRPNFKLLPFSFGFRPPKFQISQFYAGFGPAKFLNSGSQICDLLACPPLPGWPNFRILRFYAGVGPVKFQNSESQISETQFYNFETVKPKLEPQNSKFQGGGPAKFQDFTVLRWFWIGKISKFWQPDL